MKVKEAFSLLGLSPSPPPDEGDMRRAFKELALPFLALGEGDSLRHTRLWELCEAYEVRVKHRRPPACRYLCTKGCLIIIIIENALVHLSALLMASVLALTAPEVVQ